MATIKLFIEPKAEQRWETNPRSGVRYLVTPLSAERDAELQRECTDFMGVFNSQLFNAKVCAETLKAWEGLGGKDGELPCNEQTQKIFIKWHGQTEAPFVVRSARSIAHYVSEELEQAKNV